MTNPKPKSRFFRWLRKEDGTASVEFVILFPALMFIFLSAFEVGIFLTRAVLLDRALDINMRALRLGTLDPPTYAELKRRVCEDTLIFQDCPNSVMIELVPISTTTWQFPAPKIQCVNREEELYDPEAGSFQFGVENQIMLVRACAILDPFFASTPLVMDLPLDSSGGYAVTAVSAFVNEP